MPVLAKVVSKKTGFPGVGLVVGHLFAKIYSNMIGKTDNEMYRCCELYPNWMHKMLVGVLYDTPRRPLTLDELRLEPKYDNITEAELLDVYNSIPEVSLIYYPIDDLEIFDNPVERMNKDA